MMRFYVAKWRADEPTEANCEWFTNKRDAERSANECNGHVVEMEVPTDRPQLLAFLTKHLWRL